MNRPFLFGGSTSSSLQNKHLVEFKAGKMSMKDKIVSADKRKGLVFVHQTDDSLMHFCWKDRTSGTVEDDLIIFPDDVVFKKVPECTTGRVFVLKFKSSSRRCFYWLQEGKTDRDNEFCTKVNQYLNNPPSSSSRSGADGASTPSQGGVSLSAELNNLGDGDIQNLLNNISHQQLLQLIGGSGCSNPMASFSRLLGQASSSDSSRATIVETPQPPSSATTTSSSVASTPTTTTTTATTNPSSQPSSASSRTTTASSIQLSDLQNILSGLNVPAPSEASPGPSQPVKMDLSSAITAEVLQPLFNNKELMDRVKGLLPPTSESASPPPESSENIRSTVQSPQFQQALSSFSYALSSGQLGPLMQQFGMSTDVVNAANSGDMEAFVKAMQKSNKTGADGGKDSKDKDEDKDEDMSLD